jgi:hypothetical protein
MRVYIGMPHPHAGVKLYYTFELYYTIQGSLLLLEVDRLCLALGLASLA